MNNVGSCLWISVPASLVVVGDGAAIQVTPPADTLQAEILARPPAIGLPGFIQPWGEHLLVSDWQAGPNLHALDRETGEVIVSFGRLGEGPGEFASVIVGMQLESHDPSAIWVSDAERLTRIQSLGPVPSDAAVVSLAAMPQVLTAAWLDSTTIVGVNLRPPDERFVFFDRDGTVTRTVSGVLLGHDGIPMSQRVDASINFSLCVHPQGAGFAVVYVDAAKIELYDRSATHVADAAVPYSTNALFTRVDGEVRFAPERFTYSSCWADTEYLYALYSGGDYKSRSMTASMGQEIHGFAWDTGDLVRTFYLNVPVFGFSVANDLGWLYAGSLGDGGIYRFRLPAGGRE